MDKVAEFITRIRNAGIARHEKVDVPNSNLRQGIAKILRDHGYIKAFRVAQDGKQGLMRVYLNYKNTGQPSFEKLQRVSSPARRVYVKSDNIPVIRSGMGLAILSTNKGVISNFEATEQKVGGEVLIKVW